MIAVKSLSIMHLLENVPIDSFKLIIVLFMGVIIGRDL